MKPMDDQTLGRLAVERKFLSTDQLKMALEAKTKSPEKPLGAILQEMKFLDAEKIRELVFASSIPAPTTAQTKPQVVAPAPRPKTVSGAPGVPPEVAEAMKDPKNKFSKYILLGELGKGGMGVVYKGWDPGLQRFIAIKFLKDSGGDEDIKRFYREARAATTLSHPNIVPIYEVGDHEGKPYLVMKFVPGKTLDHVKPAQRKILEALRQAAKALQYAHTQGIVHRDLKPQNLMLDDDGNVWVLDFGLARQMKKGVTLTADGIVFGTPAYMSPEQATGGRSDERSDVYMLGATMYELLSGHLPFKGKNAFEILGKVVKEDPVPMSRYAGTITPEVDTIVLKCLEKLPERRYKSAGELAEDLRRYLEGEAILAEPPMMMYRMRKWVGTRKSVVIPVALACAVLIGVGIWAATRKSDTKERIEELLDRAKRQEKDDKLSEARDSYKSLLAIAPNHGDALAADQRIKALIEKRDRDREAEVDRIKKQGRSREEAFKLLDSARPMMDKALRSVYDARVSHAEMTRKVETVQKSIEDAITLAPDLPNAHFMLGRAWLFRGWEDKAEAAFRMAIAADPKHAPSLYELGRLLLFRTYVLTFQGDNDEVELERPLMQRLTVEAATLINHALQSSPQFEEGQDREFASAMLAYARSEKTTVQSMVEPVIAAKPEGEGMEDFYWLGAVVAKDSKRALEGYTKAIQIKPKFTYAYYSRGRVYDGQDKLNEAIADYTKAIDLNPRFLIAYVERGNLYRAIGDAARYRADFEEALKIDPGYPAAVIQKGIMLGEQGKFEESIVEFDRIIKANPRQATAWFNRGCSHSMMRQHDEAILDYTKALEFRPNYPKALLYRAGGKSSTGDFRGVVDDCTKVLEYVPNHPDALYDRATALARLGENGRALVDCRKAIDVAPERWRNRSGAMMLLEDLLKR